MVVDSDEVVTSNEPCRVGVGVNCEEFVISSEKPKDDGEVTSKETGTVEMFVTMQGVDEKSNSGVESTTIVAVGGEVK